MQLTDSLGDALMVPSSFEWDTPPSGPSAEGEEGIIERWES